MVNINTSIMLNGKNWEEVSISYLYIIYKYYSKDVNKLELIKRTDDVKTKILELLDEIQRIKQKSDTRIFYYIHRII